MSPFEVQLSLFFVARKLRRTESDIFSKQSLFLLREVEKQEWPPRCVTGAISSLLNLELWAPMGRHVAQSVEQTIASERCAIACQLNLGLPYLTCCVTLKPDCATGFPSESLPGLTVSMSVRRQDFPAKACLVLCGLGVCLLLVLPGLRTEQHQIVQGIREPVLSHPANRCLAIELGLRLGRAREWPRAIVGLLSVSVHRSAERRTRALHANSGSKQGLIWPSRALISQSILLPSTSLSRTNTRQSSSEGQGFERNLYFQIDLSGVYGPPRSGNPEEAIVPPKRLSFLRRR